MIDAGDDRRFLLDAMCGKLAVYLRICGYDAAYALDRGVEDDDRLRELAAEESRTLLTRDVQLAERTEGSILLRGREIDEQLDELAAAGVDLSIALDDEPERCGRCNGALRPLRDGELRPEYVPDGKSAWRCRRCGQCFWRGSHWETVRSKLERH